MDLSDSNLNDVTQFHAADGDVLMVDEPEECTVSPRIVTTQVRRKHIKHGGQGDLLWSSMMSL